MTLDWIGGDSYKPRKFLEGLSHWRDALTGGSSLTNSTDITLSTQSNSTYGKLLVSKTQSTMKIVHGNHIPLAVGQYLEISFQVRLNNGSAPKMRIISQALNSQSSPISGLVQHGPTTTAITGVDMEVSAIVGFSSRSGVDFVWNSDCRSGYFGIEFYDVNGGELVVSDMNIRDVTAAFTALHTGIVDVRDFGAIGDGTTDCLNAFVAADEAADGRTIFVPEGDYFISSAIAIHSPLQFSGRLVSDISTPIMLIHQFDLEVYVHAFKDEELAFRKAFQALFRFSDHRVLDMRGRSITLRSPIVFTELLGANATSKNNRVIINGDIEAAGSSAWETITAQSTANYELSGSYGLLTDVQNVQQIPVGSRVIGPGVGREVYVIDRDTTAKTLTLGEPLYGVDGIQSYTFERYQFMFDFCASPNIKDLHFLNVRFDGNRVASHLLLSLQGTGMKLLNCEFKSPRDRGICSYAFGCNGLTVEGCTFDGGEYGVAVQDRKTIGITTHKSDMKIRNNRAMYYRHFAVMSSTGHIISGNHIFQGSGNAQSNELSAIFVGTTGFFQSTFVGNYFDNGSIELSKEHEHRAIFNGNSFFGPVTFTGNTFLLTKDCPESFNFIRLKPLGSGNRILNFSVTNNSFVDTAGEKIYAVEGIDETLGSMNHAQDKNVVFAGNAYHSIQKESASPCYVVASRTSAATTWTEDLTDKLPFNCFAQEVTGVALYNGITTSTPPKVQTLQGNNSKQIKLNFSEATKGSVGFTVHAGRI